MKKLFPLLLLIILASCDEKSSSKKSDSENILKDFTYSLDTMILDVGAEIFNPGAYYGNGLSEDGQKLYWFYEPEKQIHEYDLVNFKLTAIHQFHTDGPNAVPPFINYFQALPNEEFFMADFARTGVYSIDGERTQNLKIHVENISGLDPDGAFTLSNNIHISPDKKKIISLPNTFTGPVEGLAVIEVDSMTVSLKSIPALDITNNYHVVFQQGNGITRSGDFQTLQYVHDQFLIYSGATSDIYIYDWKTDSLTLHEFPHELVAKLKTGEFTTNVDSNERRKEIGKQMRQQITFGKFYWDETRNQYLRFGSTTKDDNTTVYLFVYDEEFNLLGETEVEGMEYMPFQEFFRDGKLYTYLIVDEDPALIQFTFDF